jgi:hypothetical protein
MEEYNNYKLFRWNEDNILYKTDSNQYHDVYLHTGTIIKGQWQNCIAFTHMNNELKVISNSNYFLHGLMWGALYNIKYKIYDNLVNNYNEIKEYSIHNPEYSFNNDEIYFYMLGAFCFSNSGHDLSELFNSINYIITNNIKNILIYKNYRNTNNFKVLSLLLPDNCNFIELEENTQYKIKNVIIIFPEITNMLKHPHLTNKIIKLITDTYGQQYPHLHNKNIILMKTNRNKNVMLNLSQVICEDMLLQLENNNFLVLIPEEINIIELCVYLLFANKIVFATGSCTYTNSLFFNKNAKLFYLCCMDQGLDFNIVDIDQSKIRHLHYISNVLTQEECNRFAIEIINN